MQHGVDAPAPSQRVVQGSNQKRNQNGEYADALKNAQRAGIQMQHVLREVGIAQQRHTDQKPERIAEPSPHQRRSACADSICLATSSSEEWRMSLPCTI